jgi:hypothetical protein
VRHDEDANVLRVAASLVVPYQVTEETAAR